MEVINISDSTETKIRKREIFSCLLEVFFVIEEILNRAKEASVDEAVN